MSDGGTVRLMGAEEIRQRLNVGRRRAYTVIARRDFPPPYQVLAMGAVWDAAEVEAWIKLHRPELNEP